jgi:hypothetical protein
MDIFTKRPARCLPLLKIKHRFDGAVFPLLASHNKGITILVEAKTVRNQT